MVGRGDVFRLAIGALFSGVPTPLEKCGKWKKVGALFKREFGGRTVGLWALSGIH
jgi:hypothetical protein